MITHHMGTGLLSPCGLEPASVYTGFQGGFSTDWSDVDCPACLAKAPEGVGTPTPLQDFYFTFGVQYSHEKHKHWKNVHPDGWLLVQAPDEDAARRVAHRFIGNVYAFSYPEDRFKREYHPLGELGRISWDGQGEPTYSGAGLKPKFGTSDPEYYGRVSDEVVGVRIEGKPIPGGDADQGAYAELGYDVVTVHRDCAEEARGLFESITQEDPRVMAFELDWNSPVHCVICETSIT